MPTPQNPTPTTALPEPPPRRPAWCRGPSGTQEGVPGGRLPPATHVLRTSDTASCAKPSCPCCCPECGVLTWHGGARCPDAPLHLTGVALASETRSLPPTLTDPESRTCAGVTPARAVTQASCARAQAA